MIVKEMVKWYGKARRRVKVFILTLMMMLMAVPAAFATSPPPTLTIDFSVENMFTWAQTIINALLPVVYVTMGIGLGFLIIRALRSAFN
jgi:hypothetical protein